MTDRELMQQALAALVSSTGELHLHLASPTDMQLVKNQKAIAALRDRLAQPEQEPVAWRTFDGEGGYEYRDYEMNENYAAEWAQRNPRHKGWVDPLYTTPLQRKPLNETTVFFLADKYLYEGGKNYGILEFARAIESRHGIKS